MNIAKMLITPEVAENFLGHNYVRQRMMLQPDVRKLARDMAEGRWNEEIVNPIRFTKEGTLIDGQHRLMAVVKSGKSVWMWVQTDLSESDFEYIDLGRKRVPADFIDSKNRTTLASVAKFAYCTRKGTAPITSILAGYLNVSPKEKPSDVCVIKEAQMPLVEEASCLGRRIRTSTKCGFPAIFGFGAWLIKWLMLSEVIAGAKVEEYVEDILSITPTQSTSVIVAYLKNKTLLGKRFSKDELLTLFLYGYECFDANRTIKIYQPQSKTLERYNALIAIAREKEEKIG